ncbi:MAG: TIGR00730 family Rossman fold protein [Caulobacteraceae bacterium]|nr:TIGR00730 family Rossman fold protein [Caulobacteraceae bacterium]
MSTATSGIGSICVFCGSSDAADPAWLSAAAQLGRLLAQANIRLVYGGGGVGLMGACARAALSGGGKVLGVIPEFLLDREGAVPGVETIVVQSMHQRKIRMFEEADAFAVLPGAIGTLEEAIELISWRRLGLHDKPIAFWNPDGFWEPLIALFDSFVERRLVPPGFRDCWMTVGEVDHLLPALQAMPTDVRVDQHMAART